VSDEVLKNLNPGRNSDISVLHYFQTGVLFSPEWVLFQRRKIVGARDWYIISI